MISLWKAGKLAEEEMRWLCLADSRLLDELEPFIESLPLRERERILPLKPDRRGFYDLL